MKTHLECIPCALNSYLRLIETGVVPKEQEEVLFRELLSFFAGTDYGNSPPAMGREMHRIIRKALGDEDPYRGIKQKYNRMMLDKYEDFKKIIDDSNDRLNAALRLAIGGNVIDFGAKYLFDVMETIHQALDQELAIDDSEDLRRALQGARSLLYIGDNCGEIVLDKLLLEELEVERKLFVVRGGPVINDITLQDAREVGMHDVAQVISTGDDSPGAVWESASEDFRKQFQEADVIISKGQGNLEGLIDVPHPDAYFLLVTKCELIAERISTGRGNYVLRKGIMKPGTSTSGS